MEFVATAVWLLAPDTAHAHCIVYIYTHIYISIYIYGCPLFTLPVTGVVENTGVLSPWEAERQQPSPPDSFRFEARKEVSQRWVCDVALLALLRPVRCVWWLSGGTRVVVIAIATRPAGLRHSVFGDAALCVVGGVAKEALGLAHHGEKLTKKR